MELLKNQNIKGRSRVGEIYQLVENNSNIIDILLDTHTDLDRRWDIFFLVKNKEDLNISRYQIDSFLIYGVAIQQQIGSTYLEMEDVLRRRRRKYLSKYIDNINNFSDEYLKDLFTGSIKLSSYNKKKIDMEMLIETIKAFANLHVNPTEVKICVRFDGFEMIGEQSIHFCVTGCDSNIRNKIYENCRNLFLSYTTQLYTNIAISKTPYFCGEISTEVKSYDIKGEYLDISFEPVYQTKNYANDIFFIGTISSLREYLEDNHEFVGVKINSEYLGSGYKIRLFTKKCSSMNYHPNIDVYIICDIDITEDYLYTLLENNIKEYFRYILSGTGYRAPFNPEEDKKTGTYLSVEKQLIKESLVNGGFLNKKYVRSKYENENAVFMHTLPNALKIDFRQISNAKSKSTFDSINVILPIVSRGKTRKELIEFIQKNKKTFDQFVINEIESRAKFKNSNLSMNYFELSRMTLTSQSELLYIFDIKKGIRDVLEE